MTRKRYFATCQGGPCDGEVVEILGTCYQRNTSLKDGVLRTAVYEWDQDNSGLIARFVGIRSRPFILRDAPTPDAVVEARAP